MSTHNVIDIAPQLAPTPTTSPEEERLRGLVREHGSPLLLIDADRIREDYRRLAAALPGVALHYAIKALPNLDVIGVLAGLGASFDLATSGEVELVRSAGVTPQRTIHTHPVKTDAEIRHALRYGCTTFVVDNPLEMDKLRRYRHRVGLLLRVAFRAPSARCDLSRKFGCAPADVPALLDAAASRGLHVKGLSFHVGSQSGDPSTHVMAVRACLDLMAELRATGRASLYVLDIGGGFPISDRATALEIETFCEPVLRELATAPPSTRILAEPGRVLVGPAGTAVATVVGKAEREGRVWYYLDDGVYGSYSGQMYDHARYQVEVFRDGPARPSVLAGPTCDSIDVIDGEIDLPELALGDLVVGRGMGAYTVASATDFNFAPRARVVLCDAAGSLARPA